MNSALTTKARTRLKSAQAALDSALAAGEPTADLRATRDLARNEFDRLTAAVQSAEHTQTAALQDEIATAATGRADQAAAELSLYLAQFTSAPAPTPDANLLPVSLALSLELALRADAEHKGEQEAHHARGAALHARLAALQSDRQAIVARRAAGDCRATDGAELALIAADSDGLAALIAQHAADAPHDAQAQVGDYQKTWMNAVKTERARLLHLIVTDLDSRLASAVNALRDVGVATVWWRPSPELDRVIRAS